MSPRQRRAENPELERVILQDLDNEQSYRDYGEWLRSRGDPRGELSEIQAWLLDAKRERLARVVATERAEWVADFATALDEDEMVILPAAGFTAQDPNGLWARMNGAANSDDIYTRGKLEREDALVAALTSEWLAGLERKLAKSRIWITRWDWRLGFLRGATIEDPSGKAAAATFEKLARLPAARFLRDLTFAVPTYQPIIDALARDPPRTLRTLSFRFGGGEPWSLPFMLRYLIASRQRCTFAHLYAKLPQLQSLQISLHRGVTDLGRIDLPELRSLGIGLYREDTDLGRLELPKLRDLSFGGFTKAQLRSVAIAQWPKLMRLRLTMSSSNDEEAKQDGDGDQGWLEVLAPLLDAQGTPAVRWLEFSHVPFADLLPEALARSNVLKQLVVLGISWSPMSDAGAQAILDHAEAFAHLQVLNLQYGRISPSLMSELSKVCANVNLEGQKGPAWDARWDALYKGER
jgi:hypothetical protein